MASTDAKAFPIKNQAYRATFPLLDADGDLVVGATGLDSEVSKDAGTFVDCTNEATQIATSSGVYYLDLTATEMNADTVAVIVKTTSSGAKTTTLVFYPLEDADIRVNTVQWAGTATATNMNALKTSLAKGTDITGFNDIAAGTAMTLTAPYDPAKTCMQAGASVTVGTNNDKVGYSLTAAYDKAKTASQPGDAMTLTAAYDAAKLAAPAGAAMTLTPAYDAAKTASTQASVNTVAGYIDTEVGAIKTVTDKLDTALEIDGAVYRYTTNALEQAPSGGGGGATASAIADAVWDELLSGHAIAGSAGAALTGAGSAGDPWTTILPGSYGVGTAGYLIGINMDVAVSTRSTYTGTDTPGTTDLLTRIPGPITVTSGKVDVNDKTGFSLTAAYDAAKNAASQSSVNTIQTSVNTIDDYVDTEVSAIKVVTDKLDTTLQADGAVFQYTVNALELAPVGGGGGGAGDASQATLLQVKAKTDNLPSDPADASDIAASFAAVNSALATLSSYVDTEVAAIKAKTDNLPPDPADASDIQAGITSLSGKLDTIDDYVDTEVAAIKAQTDQLSFTSGKVNANTTTVLTPSDMNAIADALLKRDWNSVSGEAAYSALNAFRMLRNVWSTTGGTLTVKREDSTTTAWTRALTTDPAAQPITGAS